jgi:diketogulonate reductase-like aldo/keto reductase
MLRNIGRNLNNLRASHDGNHKIKTALTDIAKKYSVTEYKLALKFMQQAGFSIIPRSKDLDHLVENLEVFSWDILSDEMDLLWGQ